MTIESPPRSDSWNFLEPDSGSLSKLCSKIGAEGIQVEKVDLLEKDILCNLRPIYGLIFLVKHKPEFTRDDSTSNYNLYFSNQVTHNAFAMHALLNIIFNCDIDMSPELTHFKQFTKDLSPKMKGISLINNDKLREAYNSLAGRRNLSKDIYHPISYIKADGYVWELDGLKKGPLKLAACNESNWTLIAHQEILRRYEMHQRQKAPMSLWAVIENRKMVYQRKLIQRQYIKQEIENTLNELEPQWRSRSSTFKWIEEYNHAMGTDRKKRGLRLSTQLISYCESFDQLPISEKLLVKEKLREYVEKENVMDSWLQVQDEILRLYENMGIESEKDEAYEITSQRKQHDYTPFIQSYLQALFEEGHLNPILNHQT